MFKIAAIEVSKKVVLRDGLMLIAAEFILIVTIGETLEWWHGMILMLLYVGYSGYMFTSMEKSGKEEEEEEEEEEEYEPKNRLISFIKLDLEDAIVSNNKLQTNNSWVLLITATIFIAIACYVLVYGCELFGGAIGIHGYFVAVILAAAASSVPDTILSVKDAKKGNYDDAVANALGSNIFDICFALGLPLFIYTLLNGPISMPIEMVEHISELRILLLFLTIGSFLIFYFGKGMGKKKALILLAMYLSFTVYIIARAYELSWVQPVTESLHFIQSHLQ
jgi:cation:H+ antiporter